MASCDMGDQTTRKHDRTDPTQVASNTSEAATMIDISEREKSKRLRKAKAAKAVDARSFTLQHAGHQDLICTCNVWTFTDNREELDVLEYELMYEDSLSNDQLYATLKVQDCLKILNSLSQTTLPLLDPLYNDTGRDIFIPLFVGENGNEYQVQLDHFTNLPLLSCPLNPVIRPWRPDPVQLIPSRVSTCIESDTICIPKLVVPLGHLWVRGSIRNAGDMDDDDPTTECTDWDVMVDVESKEMPLWVFVSRQRLIDRREDANNVAECPLPLFNGLMTDEKCDYDSACILSSIHHLGHNKTSAPAFSNVCEIVQRSRCIRDPVLYMLPRNGLDTIAAGGEIEPMYPLEELPEHPLARNYHI